MVNKYIPKNTCNKCSEVVWNYTPETERAKCTKCGNMIQKKLHGLNGAIIDQNLEGHYQLNFLDYGEVDTYPRWEDLQEKMKELAKNDE